MPWHPRGASPLSTYDRWGHLWCSFCKSRLKSRVLAAPSGIFAIWVMGSARCSSRVLFYVSCTGQAPRTLGIDPGECCATRGAFCVRVRDVAGLFVVSVGFAEIEDLKPERLAA